MIKFKEKQDIYTERVQVSLILLQGIYSWVQCKL